MVIHNLSLGTHQLAAKKRLVVTIFEMFQHIGNTIWEEFFPIYGLKIEFFIEIVVKFEFLEKRMRRAEKVFHSFEVQVHWQGGEFVSIKSPKEEVRDYPLDEPPGASFYGGLVDFFWN